MKEVLRAIGIMTMLSARTAFGHGIVFISQDANVVARGTAFVATADNPSAIYYNPAGITQLTGHELRLGVYALTYQVDYTSPAGADSNSQRGYFPIPQFFYTFAPTNLPVAFGLGVYAPFGLTTKWPEDTGFRSVALDGDLKFLTLQPVIAWRAHPTLSLGIGPTFNYARTDLKQGLSPIPGNDSFRFKGDGFAAGFTAGIRWQPVEQPRKLSGFGVVYRSATTVDYDGHTETMSRAPAFPQKESARAEFEFPQSVTVGWSWRPTTNWNFDPERFRGGRIGIRCRRRRCPESFRDRAGTTHGARRANSATVGTLATLRAWQAPVTSSARTPCRTPTTTR